VVPIFTIITQINIFVFHVVDHPIPTFKRQSDTIIKKPYSVILPILFVVHSFAYSQFEAGTAVFIRGFNDAIVVGADSKKILADSTGKIWGSENVCKILRGNDSIFFAFSGVSPPAHDSGLNVVASLARFACLRGRNLHAIASLFKQFVVDTLQSIPFMLRNNRLHREKDAFIQIAFFGFENGISTCLSMDFVDFAILTKRDTSLVAEHEIRALKYPFHVTLGFTDEIESFLDTNKTYLGGGKDSLRIQVGNLIQLAINAHPNDVGGHIDILLLTRTGCEWLQKESECNDCSNF
jgi:hypothetical protein